MQNYSYNVFSKRRKSCNEVEQGPVIFFTEEFQGALIFEKKLNTIQKTSPDFKNLERVLKGEKNPKRVHFIELTIDLEIMEYIVSNYMNKEWISPTEQNKEAFLKQYIDFYYKMGYDSVPVWAKYKNLPQFKSREAADTAGLSREERSWVEEGGGIIKNWGDFKKRCTGIIVVDIRIRLWRI